MLERETGLGKDRCSQLCKRHGWNHYLARTTFMLTERSKSLRKAMALQFARKLYEDPDYIKVRFKNDRYSKMIVIPK